MNYPDPKLLKLSSLGYIMQDSSTEGVNVADYLAFLHLKQNPGQLRKILNGINNLNSKLAVETNKNGLNGSTVPNLSWASKPPSNNSTPWLQTAFNPCFWSSSRNLFNALVRNLGSCTSSTHLAMLHLHGLKPPKPQDDHAEFNLLLSSCPKQDSWQETFCHILYKR